MTPYVRAIREILAKRRISSSASRVVHILRTEGLTGIRTRFQFVLRRIRSSARQAQRSESANRLSIVPLYPGTLQGAALPELRDLKVAVHLHLFYRDMLPELARRLDRVPLGFDLFVSVPEGSDREAISAGLRQQIRNVRAIEIREVPNRGRDIAPLIVEFGSRLPDYDIFGHFHSKKSPHREGLREWRHDILELLFGADGGEEPEVARLFGLLMSGAKIVYPEGQTVYIKDRSGWSGNFAQASEILHKYTPLSIFDFPEIDFPEGSMFWARSDALKEFLQLPLSYEDFPEEPIPADGTLAHALERLILIFASRHPGYCARLHKGDSIRDYRFFEAQQDYREALKDNKVRVLSYYLPQFHPIPENDRWHGPGFTEWSKVRAATPLFQGHYQQHIPHPDIGYYLLDTPEVLEQQADRMRKAGISGQVFYHYWFSGKLILERPAQMLLANAGIDMPFCFCWANENWTRKWDGNEDDVLLKQTYSAEDARAFIRYLIPFFRDPRHIRIDGRPLLFVYRPANIPDVGEYLRQWAAECEASGIPKPFVVAVLTRGAADPNDFGMDAGVERVLHDWTGGHVADMVDELVPYRSLEDARVLSYAAVVEHYRRSNGSKPFTYFRSLVPNWDNSARYGAAGYLLHGSTPELFQAWLEDAIQYTRETLPADRQFILVNAWNEWAEGAHLEPDSRFGYSYLNSVGRALSGLRYSGTLNLSIPVPASERIAIRLTEPLQSELQSNGALLGAFRSCIATSSIVDQLVAGTEVARLLGVSERDPGGAPIRFELEFRRAVLFDQSMIRNMVELACAAKESVVLANAYGQTGELVTITANGSPHSWSAYDAPVVLFPAEVGPDGYRNFRVRTDAHCFVANREVSTDAPKVTTIVRFHHGGDLDILQRALFCLAAMKGCNVIPLIAAQDLSPEQASSLEALVQNVPWAPGIAPRIRHYTSVDRAGDLRAVMLNRSLQEVETRYAAFLDFDDRLMPHAYEWLLERLRISSKAIAIGRVFETLYDPQTQMLADRKLHFQYGYSYDDFLTVNIAPLHSFLLDLSKLNVASLQFFEDQRYLEDYFLLLQLVRRDNADWNGLAQDRYIGDYIRFADNRNTLAIADPKRGEALRNSPHYRLCERRIRDLRNALRR